MFNSLCRSGLLIALSACLVGSDAASALTTTTTGIAVGGNGMTTQVGSTTSSGRIKFFIPLEEEASLPTFGVTDGGTYGTTSTTYTNPATATGGSMAMWLYFAPNAFPNLDAVLTLDFIDLDLDGVNDPDKWYLSLLESVEIFDANFNVITLMDQTTEINDANQVEVTSANNTQQTITMDLDDYGVSVGEEFWLQLVLRSDVYNHYGYTLINTKEKLLATLETTFDPTPQTMPVPEPGTYALLGGGLLLACVGRRRLVQERESSNLE